MKVDYVWCISFVFQVYDIMALYCFVLNVDRSIVLGDKYKVVSHVYRSTTRIVKSTEDYFKTYLFDCNLQSLILL